MKKLFHRGLFTEVFLQLRTAGIVMACILMLTNAGPLITNITALFKSSLPAVPSSSTLAMPMMLFIYVASLVLTFIAFSWLNRRSTSDFYHALPIRRTQIYCSTVLAVMLWIAIGITGYAAVHALLYLVTGLPFNYLTYLCVYGNMLIGIIQVVGIVSLACAISGTRFVNLFAAAAILLIPRALFMLFGVFINLNADFLPVTQIFFLFNPSYNIFGTPYMVLFDGLMDALGDYGGSVDFCNALAALYSLVHALLLVFLACIAFVHRPSESAGMPIKNRFLQAVLRTAFGLPVLLLLALLIDQGTFSFYLTVILILIAFTVYCLFELISTKSAKRMLKAMPLFTICLGIAALYLFIPKLVGKAASAIQVDESEITSFEIELDYIRNETFNTVRSDSDDYILQSSQTVRIDDEQAIRMIARAYRHTVVNRTRDNTQKYIVRIHRSNGCDLVRSLGITLEEHEKLMEYMIDNTDFSEICVEYPAGAHYYAADRLNRWEANEIGKLYEEEFNALSKEDRLVLKEMLFASDSAMNHPSRIYYQLRMRGVCGTNSYTGLFVITDLTPKTAQRYTEILAKNASKDLLRRAEVWMRTGNYPNEGEKGNDDGGLLSYYSYTYRVSPDNLYIGNTIQIDFISRSYENANDAVDIIVPAKLTDPEYYEILQILLNAEITENSKEGVTIRMGSYGSYNSADLSILGIDMDSSSVDSLFCLELSDEQLARIRELYEQHAAREQKEADEAAMRYGE